MLACGRARKFRETAKIVAEQPWNLMKAAHYLDTLCDLNEKRAITQPTPLDFLLNYEMAPLHAGRSLFPAFVLEDAQAGAHSCFFSVGQVVALKVQWPARPHE